MPAPQRHCELGIDQSCSGQGVRRGVQEEELTDKSILKQLCWMEANFHFTDGGGIYLQAENGRLFSPGNHLMGRGVGGGGGGGVAFQCDCGSGSRKPSSFLQMEIHSLPTHPEVTG